MEQNPNAHYGMVVFFQWLCSCHHLMQFNFTGTSNVCRDLWRLGSIFSRFVAGIPLCPQSLALKMLCCTNELWSAALRRRIGVYFPKKSQVLWVKLQLELSLGLWASFKGFHLLSLLLFYSKPRVFTWILLSLPNCCESTCLWPWNVGSFSTQNWASLWSERGGILYTF